MLRMRKDGKGEIDPVIPKLKSNTHLHKNALNDVGPDIRMDGQTI